MTSVETGGRWGDVEGGSRKAVAGVIQTMAAARLGRGLVPHAGVVLLVAVLGFAGGWTAHHLTALAGALASALAMVLYGNGAVRKALGRSRGLRVVVDTGTGLLAYGFALYVLSWWGLRGLGAAGGDVLGILAALLFLLLSARLLWHLSRLTSFHRLARTLPEAPPDRGEEAESG